MRAGDEKYELFLKFFDTYAPSAFENVDPLDPLVIELEEMMGINNQFFYIGDMERYKMMYVSSRTVPMLGVEPKDFTPYSLIKNVHPEDFERHNLGRAKLFKMTHDVFTETRMYEILSTNFKIQNGNGQYNDILYQVLIFLSNIPYRSAFIIKVHTNINRDRKLMHRYHYYSGTDLSYFRTPDEKLLMMTLPYSRREFDIIMLAAQGRHSEEIAEMLFISPETVFTHRRNILKKSKKTSLSDVIYDLMEMGVL